MIAGATVVASTGRSRPPRPPVAGAAGLSPGGRSAHDREGLLQELVAGAGKSSRGGLGNGTMTMRRCLNAGRG